MLHTIVRTLILLALPLASITVVHAQQVDPLDFLPAGAQIRQTSQGDVDGDGRNDLVALYSLQPSVSDQPRASLLILLTTDDGVRPVHPFGNPPDGLRGEPSLDPSGSANLTLGDLNADGIAEIMLIVTVQYQEPVPRTMLWVFGRGDVPARPPDADGPLPPPWAGTGFRLEAFLEGNTVTFITPGSDDADRATALRREMVEQRLGGPDPALAVSETFRWRDGAFRLAERSLTVPAETGNSARSPETAVLAFYQAVARGDLQTATDLLGDELRASRSSTVMAAPDAPQQQMRVEEVRTVDEYLSWREPERTDRQVYVRVSMADPRLDPPHPRTTIAGTWRTQKVGEQWRLVAADLHETANLPAISRVLPPGVTVAQTAGADLRGLGVEDLAVLATSPGRYELLVPYLVFGGPTGPERAVPLDSYVGGGFYGAVGGTVRADDVNADGKPEIALSAFVGAHSALLWVLQWNGSTFAPLFAEISNSPVVDLADIDGDGAAEIVLGQSGYCGSYAASPQMSFVFRWQDGAYRPASRRYPSLHDGIDERAADLAAASDNGPHDDMHACVQYMLAMANAFRDRPSETRAAYRAYAEARQQVTEDTRLFVRPIYLAAEYVEADLRAVLAAAESGQSPGWGAPERAVLHDMLGDVLMDRARGFQYQADDAAERGRTDEAQEARRKASEARQAATREYEAALALDPTDEEARRALGE